MSQICSAFLSAAAVSLILGAVQFASGRDLGGGPLIVQDHLAVTVNRAAKADRIAEPRRDAASTRTVSLRHQDLAEISVLVRVPLSQATREMKREIKPPPPPLPSSMQKRPPTIACEPVVSVLTEVAKLLQPGRCVT
ncbi:MAG: hypothetical protein HY852_23065 [Bradyrhizobium sp.]|uniref:hypothetical protein n=1 Tax=Bradyrhizobium sp. TaxID=376 RepID=UPI0025BEDDF8|nr:hypothetical protein [Bradyrhizobium sp.]MBI5264687.1 hypothetical protein [Bradyrhizobium sp.]